MSSAKTTAESKLAHLEDCTADLQISHTRHRFSIDLVDVDVVVVADGSDQISERPTVQQLVDLPRLKTVLDGLQIFGIGKPPGWRTEFLALDRFVRDHIVENAPFQEKLAASKANWQAVLCTREEQSMKNLQIAKGSNLHLQQAILGLLVNQSRLNW